MKNLTLYYSFSCPYCHKVLDYMKRREISITLADADEPLNHAKLVEVGGKHQVPCLFIDGAALYESDDIIAYLDTQFA
jgi:glutaredoxin